jgi:plastocyanin
MSGSMRARSFNGVVTKRESVRVNRRQVLRGLGGLGLATAGMIALGRRAGAQDASPVPVATPVVGLQADGTTVWKVVVGGMDMENMIEYHGFFPGEITINAGDKIWFAEAMPMFHTVTFPVDGNVPAIEIPDPEAAPATPATAGPPKLIYNPVLLTGAGKGVVDGSQLVSTVADIFGDGTPWVLSFPKPGTYDYACIPHSSVMRAKVIVQEAGSPLPLDQAGVDKLAADQITKLQAQGLAEIAKYDTPTSTKRADGTSVWDVAVGAGGTTQARVQRFLPGELTIAVGDSITFVHRSEGEPHTVSFLGAGEAQPEDTIVESFANGMPKFVQNMETFLPQGGNVWSGKGWLNSGFMGIPQLGLPTELDVTFDTPGDYIYYCLLHGSGAGEGMAAKLTVKPAS